MAEMVIFDEEVSDLATSKSLRLEIGIVPSGLFGREGGQSLYINLDGKSVQIDPEASERLLDALKARLR